MGNGNVFESIFKAQTSINKMVIEGKRDPDEVLRYLQRIIAGPNFITILDVSHPAPAKASTSIKSESWHEEWTQFYSEVLGLKGDLTSVAIPKMKPGFGWVVMVAQGLTLNQVWAKCQELFKAYSYYGDDLDQAVPKSDRDTKTAYARRFRDCVEADEELKNLSANQVAKRGIQSITLLECLLLELWYFWKTHGHLDLQNVTLCAGSRYEDGHVPCVDWGDGRLGVYDYYPGSYFDSIRARAAV